MNKLNVLVFGSSGLVGSSLVKKLSNSKKISNLIASTREDTNLFSFQETSKKIKDIQPDVIINAAAKVGGIVANNTYRSEFLIENLKININILESCIPFKSIKIINLGSSCIYPLNASNPIKEDSLLTGKLEPTNSPYAIAKISAIELGLAMKKQFGHEVINLMPTNLYGPNDNFSENNSHVIPGLIYRMYLAKINNDQEFKVWGSGNVLREFLYVDDLSSCIEFLIDKKLSNDVLNVGSDQEISIRNLSELIKNILDYEGKLTFDKSKPDGNPRKLLDNTLIKSYGWKPSVGLEEGLKLTYNWFVKNFNKIRK